METSIRQAVVLDPFQMKAFTGADGLYGACLMDDGVGQCFVFFCREELLAALHGYQVCPSGYSDITAILDYDVEMEAISQIADFAISKSSELSSIKSSSAQVAKFIDYGPRYYQGLKIRLTPWGLDALIGEKLATSLGWREGERVNLVVSPCSGFLAIEKADYGPELNRVMSDPDSYSLDRVFANVPIFVKLAETEWGAVPYHILDDKIIISSEIASPESEIKSANYQTGRVDLGEPTFRKSNQLWFVFSAVLLLLIGIFLLACS